MKVSFIHGRNSKLRSFERFFRCPVEFGASSDQFAFSHDTLALPLITEDRYLLETLQPICDAAAKDRRTPVGTLRAKVENEVQKLLPHGKAKRHNVANILGLSERTLSRRLADKSATYHQVLDELRRSLAREYVKERACRFHKWRGSSATKGRVLSITLSGDGRAARRPKFETRSCFRRGNATSLPVSGRASRRLRRDKPDQCSTFVRSKPSASCYSRPVGCYFMPIVTNASGPPADWPKIARRSTRPVRSERLEGVTNDRD